MRIYGIRVYGDKKLIIIFILLIIGVKALIGIRGQLVGEKEHYDSIPSVRVERDILDSKDVVIRFMSEIEKGVESADNKIIADCLGTGYSLSDCPNIQFITKHTIIDTTPENGNVSFALRVSMNISGKVTDDLTLIIWAKKDVEKDKWVLFNMGFSKHYPV